MAIPKRDWPKWLEVDLLQRMMTEVDTHPSRSLYLTNAKEFYKVYRGHVGLKAVEGIDDTEIDDRQATARRNLIAEATDEIESIFMKNWPVVRRWPLRPEDADLSDAQDAQWLSAWDETNGQFVLSSMLRQAEITGLSVGKVVWNPENKTKHKDGEIMFEVLPPECIRVDPHASNTQRGRDVRYIIHSTLQPVEEIVGRYGTEAAVAMGMRKPQGKKRSRRGRMAMFAHMSKREATAAMSGNAGGKGSDIEDDEWVHEFWIFPRTQGMSQMVDNDPTPAGEYPYGLVATMVNDHIVRVIKNPFVSSKKITVPDQYGYPQPETVKIGHKRHPFLFLWWKRITDVDGYHGMYDCMGMVEQMVPVQFNINALRRNVAINARTVANPPLAINPDLVEDPIENVTLQPGQILRINTGVEADRAVKLLNPGQMSNFAIQFLMSEMASAKEITGLKPGVVGLFPQGGGTSHTPFATVGTLQQSAFAPLEKYVKELTAALEDVSILYDGLMQLKYKPGRYAVVTRNGGQQNIEWTERNITANFRRHVVAGATTAMYDMDKQVRVNEMAVLVKEALVSKDPGIVLTTIVQLENLNDPWRYDLIEVLKSEYQKLTQMQQEMQQLGMAGMAGGLPGQGTGAQDGLAALAEETGRDPEKLMLALAQ